MPKGFFSKDCKSISLSVFRTRMMYMSWTLRALHSTALQQSEFVLRFVVEHLHCVKATRRKATHFCSFLRRQCFQIFKSAEIQSAAITPLIALPSQFKSMMLHWLWLVSSLVTFARGVLTKTECIPDMEVLWYNMFDPN